MSWRRSYWLAVGAIIALALILRTIPLTYSHFWDETVFLQNARVMLGWPDNYSELDYRPPLLPLLYAAGFTAWNHIYAANLVQGAVTTLVVVFGFLYVRDSFGRVPALIASALFAFTPYLVGASHDLLTDAPALAIMLAAMWAFERPGARFLLLSGVLYALAVQTRFTSLFLGLYFVLQAILVQRRPLRLVTWGIAAGLAVLPYLVWAQLRFGSMLHPFALARRIVTEWTAPVPAGFYVDALTQVFPALTWLLFALGILIPVARALLRSRSASGTAEPGAADANDSRLGRRVVLLVWGIAFFCYMLSIPHKEVRYLMPLFIPVTTIAALGLTDLVATLDGRLRVAAAGVLLLCVALAVRDYTAAFGKLTRPWVNSTQREVVQIGRYLNEVSGPNDTIYAAHEFPVLAFYSERRTVSLLPIQDDFEAQWREVMARPGYFVYFRPAGIGETHSRNSDFKPDRAFADAHRQFRAVREFPLAVIYRYEP